MIVEIFKKSLLHPNFFFLWRVEAIIDLVRSKNIPKLTQISNFLPPFSVSLHSTSSLSSHTHPISLTQHTHILLFSLHRTISLKWSFSNFPQTFWIPHTRTFSELSLPFSPFLSLSLPLSLSHTHTHARTHTHTKHTRTKHIHTKHTHQTHTHQTHTHQTHTHTQYLSRFHKHFTF